MFVFSNRSFSRSRGTSSRGSRSEGVAIVEDKTIGNSTPSKAGVALKCQATKIEATLVCLQTPRNHVHDHAFTDACKKKGGKEFTVRYISKYTCKHLPNIQPQGSVIVRPATWLYPLTEEAGNEDAAYLLPPDASAVEHSQVPTVLE